MLLKRGIIIVVLVLVSAVRLNGFNLATHLWLGDQTLDIWENYDPQFAYDVAADDDNQTRRMYRIGLMLPEYWTQ